MIQTIRITAKNKKEDHIGIGILQEIKKSFPKTSIHDVQFVKVYRIEGVSENKQKLWQLFFF
jgi:hypothetical protein